MGETEVKHVVIFKTAKLQELDMAASALSERNIPFFKQEESSSGARFAMSFQPAMGPGTWFSILVANHLAEEAKGVLSNLPFNIQIEPDIWHFDASGKQKRGWKVYIWFVIILFFLIAGIYFFQLFF